MPIQQMGAIAGVVAFFVLCIYLVVRYKAKIRAAFQGFATKHGIAFTGGAFPCAVGKVDGRYTVVQSRPPPGAVQQVALFQVHVGVRGDPCPHSPIHVDDMAWQLEALLDAGRVYREQLGAPDKAQECFEAALVEDPANAEALRSLAAVLAAETKWEEARKVLTRQLELTQEPTARAAGNVTSPVPQAMSSTCSPC